MKEEGGSSRRLANTLRKHARVICDPWRWKGRTLGPGPRAKVTILRTSGASMAVRRPVVQRPTRSARLINSKAEFRSAGARELQVDD